MKTLLGLILVFFLSFYSNAQQIVYQPMHGSTTNWVMRASWFTVQLEESYGRTYCSGDTVINGYTYNKIYGGYPDVFYRGGFREDIPNQQRYFIDEQSVETNMTIDQFLNVGDTLLNVTDLNKAFNLNGGGTDLNASDTLIVQDKDSVLELNGNYSVTYNFSVHGESEYDGGWIIYNAVRGLLSYQAFEYATSLQCYVIDGEPYSWIGPDFIEDMCNAGLSDLQLNHSISPNPSTGKFQLTSIENKQLTYTVTDLYGNKIVDISPNPEIDLTQYPPGCYFVNFIGSDGISSSLKIMKQ